MDYELLHVIEDFLSLYLSAKPCISQSGFKDTKGHNNYVLLRILMKSPAYSLHFKVLFFKVSLRCQLRILFTDEIKDTGMEH